MSRQPPDWPGPAEVETYGEQATISFPAPTVLVPQQQERPCVDVANDRAVSLWRVSAVGLQPTQRWRLRLIYGTASSIMLTDLEAPLVAYVPGSCQLYAFPLAQTAKADLQVSLKPVAGYNLQHVRSISDNTAGVAPLSLPSSGVRFTALIASTVTVAGAAVALAANATLFLTGPATLAVGGLGIVEHEL